MQKRVKGADLGVEDGHEPGYEEDTPAHERQMAKTELGDQDTKGPHEGEKYSSQVLRQMHEDDSNQLEAYDDMHSPLEHEPTRAHLEKKMKHLADNLDETENLHKTHHPDYPPIGGGKGLDDGVAADSGNEEEEEEPTGDEALEGMETKALRDKYLKALRARLVKGLCPKCGKSPCVCDKKNLGIEDGHDPGYEEDTPEHDEAMEETEEGEMTPEEEEGPLHSKALQEDEKPHVQGAADFLEQVGQKPSLEEDDRHESYHWHKMLEPIHTMHGEDPKEEMDIQDEAVEMTEPGEIGEKGQSEKLRSHYHNRKERTPKEKERHRQEHHPKLPPAKEPKQGKNMESAETAQDLVQELHPHRQKCRAAGRFLHSLAHEKAFGEPHRQEALFHFKELNPTLHEAEEELGIPEDEEEEVSVETGETPGVTPGERGEKAKPKKKPSKDKLSRYDAQTRKDQLTRHAGRAHRNQRHVAESRKDMGDEEEMKALAETVAKQNQQTKELNGKIAAVFAKL